MKIRIISGAVLVALTAAVLFAGSKCGYVLVAALAVISAIAVYEILNNTGIVKSKIAVINAMIADILFVLAYFKITQQLYIGFNSKFIALLLVLSVVIISLIKHRDFGLASISAAIAFPIIISFAFTSIGHLYLRDNGLFYLLMLLNCSSLCDCGAYFTGVTLGKHKLCPDISPKKTLEGAVGGIVISVIASVVLCITLYKGESIVKIIAVTVFLCIVGMCGDLFASVIKRSVKIKDYGNLIPGHGGILDRFDSILLISPVLLFCVERGLL